MRETTFISRSDNVAFPRNEMSLPMLRFKVKLIPWKIAQIPDFFAMVRLDRSYTIVSRALFECTP